MPEYTSQDYSTASRIVGSMSDYTLGQLLKGDIAFALATERKRVSSQLREAYHIVQEGYRRGMVKAWDEGYAAAQDDAENIPYADRPERATWKPTPNPYASAQPAASVPVPDPAPAPPLTDVILRMIEESPEWMIRVPRLIDKVRRETGADQALVVNAIWDLDNEGKIQYGADACIRLTRQVQTNPELWR